MSRFDDDLSPFRDDPLFQALTGPATPEELAREAEVMAAYRAANPARLRRRVAARLGTGGAVAAAAVALSGGVAAAAAYSAVLPSSMQEAVHDVFGPLGVPPSNPHRHPQAVATFTPRAKAAAPAYGGASPGPAPTETPSPQTSPGTPSAQPTASASPTTSTLPLIGITPTPSPTPSSTASGSVAANQPPIPGATLQITISDDEVAYDGAVTISGTLTDETGAPVADRQIVLVEHLVGEPGWTKVSSLGTDAHGQVDFTVPHLEHNARFVLRAGGRVRSAVVTVTVDPTISTAVASPATDEADTTVTVTVVGAQPGDVVVLGRLGRHRESRTAELSTAGQATFTVPVPRRHAVSYRVVVRRTDAHEAAAAMVQVPAQPLAPTAPTSPDALGLAAP